MEDPRIIISIIGWILSAVLCVVISLILFIKGRGRTAAFTLGLTLMFVTIFDISHVIGTSVLDHNLSRDILMWNISIIFIISLNCHSVFALIGKEKEQKPFLVGMYVFGVALALIYLVFPDTFLLESQAKMYLQNYYVPGSLHWIMRLVFNGIVPSYFFYQMWRVYQTADAVMKNRIKFFSSALALAYSFGTVPVFLIFNVPVDPIWGIFFIPLFSIPFAYGVMKYELMDIRILAKRALFYSLLVGVLGLALSFLSYFNNRLFVIYPSFPQWLIPVISAVTAVGIGIFVWNKLRENDVLKYEFVNVVTHKFRTPLTHIKWLTESILSGEVSPEKKKDLNSIQESTSRLVELTNLLVTVSENEEQNFLYQMEKVKLGDYIKDIISTNKYRFEEKRLQIILHVDESFEVVCDKTRVKFVLQTFIENAIHYTPEGGTITISLNINKGSVLFSVRDSGIGITEEEMAHAFERFYRGVESKRADTEGMGIGLYLSKQIIERHGGKIHVESLGRGRGSMFLFSLPVK